MKLPSRRHRWQSHRSADKARKHQELWAEYLRVPVVQTNSIGMKLVLIPPGEFDMGSPKELVEEERRLHGSDGWYRKHLPGESPQHRVRITKPYWLGVTEVTQEEYQRVMGSNPSKFSATAKGKGKVAGQDMKRFPVENVTWDEAVEFCRKLSSLPEEKLGGLTYRLPSECSGNTHAVREARVSSVSVWAAAGPPMNPKRRNFSTTGGLSRTLTE